MIGADVTFDGPQPGHEVVEIPRLRAALEVLDVHLVERLIEHRQRHVDSSVLLIRPGSQTGLEQQGLKRERVQSAQGRAKGVKGDRAGSTLSC
jgi:hypothetical protein